MHELLSHRIPWKVDLNKLTKGTMRRPQFS